MDEDDPDTTYLDEVEDGCGCAEMWEKLYKLRNNLPSDPDK